jgi:MarR family transcriptional regulator, 2-MHQ and catechol-resistance regulon repressor
MTTHYVGPPSEQQALDTYVKLVRASESVTHRLHRPLSALDLTVSQFGVLEALLHLGPLCQKDLAAKLLKSGGNLTLVIDNLEKRNLVTRQRGVKDRRFFSIHLTPEGATLIQTLFPNHAARVVQEMQILTPAEQQELARLLKKLGRQQED